MKVNFFMSLMYLTCIISQNVSADEDVPEMALLEFLGSFEIDDEQWFDPTLLVDVDIFEEGLDKGQNNEHD
jgi:hypothetical protein